MVPIVPLNPLVSSLSYCFLFISGSNPDFTNFLVFTRCPMRLAPGLGFAFWSKIVSFHRWADLGPRGFAQSPGPQSGALARSGTPFSDQLLGSLSMHLHSNHVHFKPYTGPKCPIISGQESGGQTLYRPPCPSSLPDNLSGSLSMHLHSNHVHFKFYTGTNSIIFWPRIRRTNPVPTLMLFVSPGPPFRELLYAFTSKPCAFQTLYRNQCFIISRQEPGGQTLYRPSCSSFLPD